jgi:hypothetical protein
LFSFPSNSSLIPNRTLKELESYRVESISQEKLVSVMQTDHLCCPHDLKKQKEVLEETNAMLSPCKTRLLSAIHDIEDFMVLYNN